jgi:tetratricopeptide (TPR) repeat protein
MTDSAASDLAHAEMLADRALAAFPSTALVHYAKAQVLRAPQRFEEAILQYEQVLALNRNWVRAIAGSRILQISLPGRSRRRSRRKSEPSALVPAIR